MSSKRIIDLRLAKPLKRLVFFRTPEKRPSLRDRRRKIRFVALGAILAVFATLLWAFHAFSHLGQLTIQQIDVQGTQKVPPELVRSYVSDVLDDGKFHYIARRNIFFYPKAAIAEAIVANFPRVASASLLREKLFSTTLIVTIYERVPFARWCIDISDAPSSCFFLDESGYIFAAASDLTELPQTAYRFSGGSRNVEAIGRSFAPGDFAHMLALINALHEEGYAPESATLESGEDFSLVLQRGYYLKVSHETEPHIVVRNLDLVLSADALAGKESQLEYIDLRFGNRVYYKLRGQEEVSSE